MPSRRVLTNAEAFRIILDETKHRPLVPFLGAGISVASGFPSIKQVNQYLAKVDFAIHCGVFRYRYPSEQSQQRYRDHPSEFLTHFGWPPIGQLDSAIWQWLTDERRAKDEADLPANEHERRRNIRWLRDSQLPDQDIRRRDHLEKIEDDLAYDLTPVKAKNAVTGISIPVDQRDFLTAITQFHLRRDLERLESGAEDAALRHWKRWKRWYRGKVAVSRDNPELPSPPGLLFGNWESLLDHLCEGNFDLIDQLFSQLEHERSPSKAHRYLAHLKTRIDSPLVMTTNFDRLLEVALREEDLKYSVFDVHRDAQLPDPYMILRQFSVLKLHGSSYGLRLGERLKYPLDAVARKKILQFMPESALVLVAGFSGYERRMLQLLRAIAEQGNKTPNGKPKILWLTLGKLSGWPSQLLNEFPDVIKEVVIEDAGTFLQELYFRHSNAYPPAKNGYKALTDGTRYKGSLPSAVSKTGNHEVDRCQEQESYRKPIHLFAADNNISPQRGSEWATLGAAAFAHSRTYEYRQIWISLENHHTVAGIVSEFFAKVRQFDPYCPKIPLNLYEASTHEQAKRGVEYEFDKVTDRIVDVFQRGKYILILDLLESFGRPQMMHHGVPSYEVFSEELESRDHKERLEGRYKIRVDRLKTFLARLTAKCQTTLGDGSSDAGFGESYICVTIGGPPSQRFSDNSYAIPPPTKKAVEGLLDFARSGFELQNSENYVANHVQRDENYLDFGEPNLRSKPNAYYWSRCTNECDTHRSWQRSIDVAELVAFLKGEKGPHPDLDAQCGFIGLVSIFRRARPLPIIRSIIERWIGGSMPRTKSDLPIGELVDSLIDASTRETSPFGSQTARMQEGGDLWLFREVRDSAYEGLTENLSIAAWVNSWRNGFRAPKPIEPLAAVADGLTAITWHWAAARTYYADAYRATRDIEAFYEYLYHRVSALRTINLVIAILSRCGSKKLYKGKEKDLSRLQDYVYGSQKFANRKGIVDVLGVFSPLGVGFKEKADLGLALRALRREGLETLFYALHRNRDSLRRNATPSTLRGWANQFLEREIFDLSGSVFLKGISNELFLKALPFNELSISGKDQLKKQLRELNRIESDETPDDRASRDALSNLLEFFARLRFDAEIADMSFPAALEVAEENFRRLGETTFSPSKSFKKDAKVMKFAALHDKLLCELEIANLGGDPSTEFDSDVNSAIESLKADFSDRDQLRRFLEIKTHWRFRDFPVWRVLDDRKRRAFDETLSGSLECSPEEEGQLDNAEKFAIEYEKVLRSTATATDDDRRHRTSALTLRARSLYLRSHFREAHRWLDIAASGLSEQTVEQRTSLASVHLRRAELLTCSAFWHRFSKRNDRNLESNKQKLQRAEQELSNAKRLLEDSPHLPLWRVQVDLGIGIVITDGLLFDLDEISSHPSVSLDDAAFAVRSGRLEQRVLKAMRYIRRGLDTIPISVEERPTEVCLGLEKFAYSRWQQLFVVYLATASALRILTTRQLASNSLLDWVSTSESFLEMDLERWRNWAHSMRFSRFAEIAGSIDLSRHDIVPLHGCDNAMELVLRMCLQESDNKRCSELWRQRKDKFRKPRGNK